jgi:hypothetical protein
VEVLQLQTWNRDGATETLYIAMDEADLIELRGVMDRALDKTATLREMLEEQELTCFELDERNL